MPYITETPTKKEIFCIKHIIGSLTKKKVAAAERYYASVTECNYSFCPHYNHRERRCSLELCAYDRKNGNDWDEKKYRWKDGGKFEWLV